MPLLAQEVAKASFTIILDDFNHMLFKMILYYQVYP